MAFFSLGGVPQRVVDGSFVRRASVYQGGRERMLAGNIVSTESNPMRVYDFKVVWLTLTEEAAVRTAYPRGEVAALQDEDGFGFSGLVELGETEFVRTLEADGTKTVYRRCAVHVEETVVA